MKPFWQFIGVLLGISLLLNGLSYLFVVAIDRHWDPVKWAWYYRVASMAVMIVFVLVFLYWLSRQKPEPPSRQN
jgi:uncharacterized BrkB/YihY/UPF0761 family membrane protein